jgi:ribonuclease-3
MTREAPTVIFTTSSDVEAAVVTGLLESHGVAARRLSGSTQAILPMTVSTLGAIRIAVPEAQAAEATRILESHREAVGERVVRIRDEFGEIQARIGYTFRDIGLLEQALTHRSRAAEDLSGGVVDNELLEFLGDAVLGLVVADVLVHQFPHYHEGQTSKIKGSVVSTRSLADHAERLGLGQHLLLGRGEEKSGGRSKPALLADTYEALVAALYLDGGLEAAAAFLRRELKAAIDAGATDVVVGQDFKSALQERLQAHGRPPPDYVVAAESGPDHQKEFEVEVRVGDDVLGRAGGRSKKTAEQDAARQALEALGPLNRSR